MSFMVERGRWHWPVRREGLILPVVLLVIALLALLGSSFSWLAQADYQATNASAHRVTARLAAESGVQRALVLLRSPPEEFMQWWDNEDALGRQIVWLPNEDIDIAAESRTADDLEEKEPAWLYSIVADDPNDDEPFSLRYGLTDEASKLNLNVINGEMMARLIELTVPRAEELDLPGLVDAFLDWRDGDGDVRPAGAEKEYYEALRPPYEPRNGRLETVEELLMVRGFTSQVLYGEDQNRNGILDPNEDDGEASWPDDNADGELNRGIYPYLTVFSRETSVSQQGQQKLDINSANEAALSTVLTPELARFIVAARQAGVVFESPADLIETPPVPDPETGDFLNNPTTAGDLSTLMDLLTANPPAETEDEEEGVAATSDDGLPKPDPNPPGPQPMVEGKVNINTAPAPVLKALGVFTDEEVDLIVSARLELDEEERQNMNWLSAAGVSQASVKAAAPYLTIRAEQYTIESVGYASHLGVISRLQVVVEMRYLSVPFVRYYRDISALGPGYPVQQLLLGEEEREGTFGQSGQRS
ncbi:MAG: general secretion pathway protein GspK [Phycisphaerales bacterium]|nr:MAG: general secretion pathway protein GspK [Phycisphaerales bacterium]